ncbi:hypothetical protein [Streptomyces cinerochromogenes]|nr:hypothetical protein [Streptomyces cinerochromogenes]GGS69919.1 hypothetical protein GCM10010206_35270 [Streptomyces cinerochromogenes]
MRDQAVEPNRRDRPAGFSKTVNRASGHGVVYATQNGDLPVDGRTPR